MHAYVLQFTTDMPGGDKLLNAKGHNAFCPGRFRLFFDVRADRRYYYPPVNTYTKRDGSASTGQKRPTGLPRARPKTPNKSKPLGGKAKAWLLLTGWRSRLAPRATR